MKITRSYTKRATGEPFTVELEIDLEEIAHALASRAIVSKLGKARALGGDIKCRIVSRGATVPQTT